MSNFSSYRFDPKKSFKVGDTISFQCGGERKGVVVELGSEYFIIGKQLEPRDSLSEWIFYAAKDYGKISHLVIVNGV